MAGKKKSLLKFISMKSIIITATFLTATQFISCDVENKEDIKGRPNILFAISDGQSFGHTSFDGCEFIETPAFDHVTRVGVYFTNYMAGSPDCAPSPISLVTGRHHLQNEQ
jgi:N-sulfoglucosamine sulfohydrolase